MIETSKRVTVNEHNNQIIACIVVENLCNVYPIIEGNKKLTAVRLQCSSQTANWVNSLISGQKCCLGIQCTKGVASFRTHFVLTWAHNSDSKMEQIMRGMLGLAKFVSTFFF